MPRQRPVIRIAPGIYRDGDQLVAEVRIGSSHDAAQIRKRQIFPLGTDLRTMQAWQYGEKSKGLLARPAVAGRGTLAADIPEYLKTLPAGRYKVDSTEIFKHWSTSPLGDLSRQQITRMDIIGQIGQWTEAGSAAATCNRRLSRLRKFYETMDGPTVAHPTDAIKFLRQPETEARDVPARIVELILDSLTDHGRADRGGDRPDVSLTKIRLRVMAWTGMAPATIRRLRPRDLDLTTGRIYLHARRKGKGAAGAWVSLLPQGVEALKAFADAKLFGLGWSNSSMGKTWRVGIKRAIAAAAVKAKETGDETWARDMAQLPPRCKPYDLRHSFASEVYRTTGDIRAVAELLQHADLETTKRYTKGAVSERVAAAIAKVTEAHIAAGLIKAPPPPPPKPAPKFRLVKRKEG